MEKLNSNTNLISLIKMFALIFIIQILRIITTKIFFLFIDKTILNNIIINAAFMSLFILLIVLWSKIKRKDLSITYNIKKNKITYLILTIITLLLIFTTPIFNGGYTFEIIFTLIYSVIITPIFEELIFRGYIWNYLKGSKTNEFATYIFVTILFAIWHIGYIDSIMLNMSYHNFTENIYVVMLYKVLTCFILGIIIGFPRYKTKNTYSSVLIHSIINIFGK